MNRALPLHTSAHLHTSPFPTPPVPTQLTFIFATACANRTVHDNHTTTTLLRNNLSTTQHTIEIHYKVARNSCEGTLAILCLRCVC